MPTKKRNTYTLKVRVVAEMWEGVDALLRGLQERHQLSDDQVNVLLHAGLGGMLFIRGYSLNSRTPIGKQHPAIVTGHELAKTLAAGIEERED